MPNNDYILRSDAVSAFCGNCEATEVCRQIGEPCEEVKQIKAIPAADVEPVKHGRWIKQELAPPKKLFCSECSLVKPKWGNNYCPGCGAKMDVELPKEEDDEGC